MSSEVKRKERPPFTYCWPPIVCLGPIGVGYAVGAMRPEVFVRTHGYYEIAAMIGFGAAAIYAFRLWPKRREPGFRVPLCVNLSLLLLVPVVGLLSWLVELTT